MYCIIVILGGFKNFFGHNFLTGLGAGRSGECFKLGPGHCESLLGICLKAGELKMEWSQEHLLPGAIDMHELILFRLNVTNSSRLACTPIAWALSAGML